MSSNDYEIREAREDEKPHLGWLLRDHFYHDEILNRTFVEAHADLRDPEGRRSYHERLLQRHEKFMAENPCLVAVHRASNQPVGLCLLSLHDNPKFDKRKTPSSDASVGNDAASTWLRRFVDLFSKYDGFQVHPEVRDSLEIKFVIVVEEHRRRGLAEGLMRAAVDLARTRNVGMVESLLTSPYTFRIAERLGFSSFAEDDAATIKDKYGNLAFPGIDSHVIFAMSLKL